MGDAVEFVQDHSIARGLSGQAGADAAKEGAEVQAKQSGKALDILRSDLDPFRKLGADQIAGVSALASGIGAQNQLLAGNQAFQDLSNLSTDPNAQFDFLQNNALFDNLMDASQREVFANQAARGKLGSGGTALELQNRFLEGGNALINQQINRQQNVLGTGQNLINEQLNRQMPLLNLGQASAAQVGAGSSELLTGIGNAQAAGGIGAANAQAQGAQNVAGLGIAALSALSDKRLKTNIQKVGEHNGLNVYTWDWNEEASKLGKTGSGRGHIAQELQESHPHLVDGSGEYLRINYSTEETTEAS